MFSLVLAVLVYVSPVTGLEVVRVSVPNMVHCQQAEKNAEKNGMKAYCIAVHNKV